MGNSVDGVVEWSGLEALEPELRRYLRRRCRDHSEVDDVVQETLLRAARYRPALMAPERIGGWTQRIASNVLRDRRRREGRLRWVDLDPVGLDRVECARAERGARDGSAPDELGETIRLGGRSFDLPVVLEQLEIALGQIPDADRRVLRSYYGSDGCAGGTARAARELRIDRNLVKVRLFRARRRLGAALRQRLAESRVGALGV